MQYLWKKSPNAGPYINFLEMVRSKNIDSFKQWDELLIANLKWLSKYEYLKKNNQIAEECLNQGRRKQSVGNLDGAIESYNQSACFAEVGSLTESLAYAYRSECFFEEKQYIMAWVDINLASKCNHSERIMKRLRDRKAEIIKLLSTGIKYEEHVPKLSFGHDRNILCMANVLEIRENNEYGRHIVAKCNIDEGKIILVTDIFAAATISSGHSCCSNCNKIQQNLIPCANCTSTMFCYGKCSNRQDVHKLECGSFFSITTDVKLKLAVQTLLVAISLFPTIDELMKFVEKVNEETGLPNQIKTLKDRYKMFLKLSQCPHDDRYLLTYKTYTVLLTIPQVSSMLDSEKKKMFIMHLALHHLAVIPNNAFAEEKFNRSWITTNYVYDVLSLFNHSCDANVFNYSTSSETCYCITKRPIVKGEQIFINYLGNNCKESKEFRQNLLQMWNFECNCAKCNNDGYGSS